MKRNNLISYAMEFAGFLVRKIDIRKIILYGSVARGDFDSDSDIDLFVDIDKKKNKKIQVLQEEFYKTENAKKWRLKGVKNEFSIIAGDIESEEWKDLKRAIINTGILLYGKYRANAEKNYSYSVFVFENIKPDKKRIGVFRKLFGFKLNKQNYLGLVQQLNGIKLGKSAILIPLESVKKIKDYFNEKKVKFKIYDFWTDAEI
ncbi:nucleotidyltransferase domain-containing protein [Candidatus Pacearchaeota archaeon]|nr:nucleotidyltransferase domain-containing protein [Candidatus Pacearchaeota archaeon]